MHGNSDTLVVQDNAGATLTGAAPAAPAGLASLDFELPVDRELYDVYRFTTPGGEAELTARTIDNSTLARLLMFAGIVAVGLLVWFASWLIRRGALRWFLHPVLAGLLAMFALALLCLGVFPLFALAVMLTG